MKKTLFSSVLCSITVFMLLTFGTGISLAESINSKDYSTLDYSPLDVIVLFPGDSRSIEFEFDNTFWDPESFHVALIFAMSPDNQIHQLSINLTPVGDVGSEIAYFTWGAFIFFPVSVNGLLEFLEPKFTYGHKHVSYIVDVNPSVSMGFIFSAAMVEYSYFDFPLNMTMTLTLSN